MEWRLGTMGFGYADWADVFYPHGVKPAEYLSFYARHFSAVELDTTFHATPDPERVQKWRDETPADFRFAVKTPRQITHESSLERAIEPKRDFLHVCRHFEHKLSAVLLQFAPSFDAKQATKLRTFLSALPTREIRIAAEFRHSSWFAGATTKLLEAHNVAWCAADYVAPARPITITSDFLYVRWIGEHGRFRELNREQIDVADRLHWWQRELTEKTTGMSGVYGFFNNDYAGYAVATCNRFKEMLGLSTQPIEADPGAQGKLFD